VHECLCGSSIFSEACMIDNRMNNQALIATEEPYSHSHMIRGCSPNRNNVKLWSGQEVDNNFRINMSRILISLRNI